MKKKTEIHEYSFFEIVELTSISKRNIKFWCSVYQIKPNKRGRNNYYSEKQFQLLNLINSLSQSALFTQKFIKLIVDFNLDRIHNTSKIFLPFHNNLLNLFKVNNTLKSFNYDFFPLKSLDNKYQINENQSVSASDKIAAKPVLHKKTKNLSDHHVFSDGIADNIKNNKINLNKQDFLL